MSDSVDLEDSDLDAAPGEQGVREQGVGESVRAYLIGLALAAGLTVASFWLASDSRGFVYGPGVLMGLATLAIAQMGVHLTFFLHITTGPDNINNALALAFGVLIIALVIAGTLWIMYNLNVNMMAPGSMMSMPAQD